MPTGPEPPRSKYLLDSPEALSHLAEHLAYDFDRVHAVALTDTNGTVIDGILLSDPAHNIDHAVGFALCLAMNSDKPDLSAVFFSITSRPAATPSNASAAWHRMNEVLAAAVHVRDWILTDGTSIRSMARQC